MYTIVAASQKGGSGKTTLSGHLAVEACKSGAGDVALIDTDPQGSLTHWWNARKAKEPHFVKAGLLDLKEALAHLDRIGIRIAIIDTPPAITESISQVVAHADLVIVPTRPSPHDLRAVGQQLISLSDTVSLSSLSSTPRQRGPASPANPQSLCHNMARLLLSLFINEWTLLPA
jgi:cellulose biosynthesis protein BcsQ